MLHSIKRVVLTSGSGHVLRVLFILKADEKNLSDMRPLLFVTLCHASQQNMHFQQTEEKLNIFHKFILLYSLPVFF